jgi:hypothetical protein
MRAQQDSRTILLMRKQGDGSWPAKEFNAYLNSLMVDAGIPLSSQGVPNSVVFFEITGIDPGATSRWRSGKSQPTVQSLRKVAAGLAPLLGMSASALLVSLEVKAGRRSEDEAREVRGSRERETQQLVDYIRRAHDMAAHPDLPSDRRAEILGEIERAEVKLKAARDIERSAGEDLRKVLDAEDVTNG